MNDITKVGVEFRGLSYRLAAIKRDISGEVVSRRDSELCPNLFTDYGVDNLFAGPMMNGIFVGTGSTAPTVSDLYMAAYKASGLGSGYYWNRYQHNDLGANLYEIVDTLTYTFPAGVATGNIAEVGVSFDSIVSANPATTKLASRALVVDGGGAPTTFPVLADEELQLTIFATRRVNYADRVSTITVNGVDYTVTVRPYLLASSLALTNQTSSLDTASRVSWGTSCTLASPFSGAPTIAGPGNGGNNLLQGSFGTAAAYVAGSKTRSYTIGDPTGTARSPGIVGLELYLGHCGAWQVKFDPPIPKSALQKFTASFSASITNPTS